MLTRADPIALADGEVRHVKMSSCRNCSGNCHRVLDWRANCACVRCQLSSERVQRRSAMESKSSLEDTLKSLRFRLTQILVSVRRNWLLCALVLGAGWVVGQLTPASFLKSSEPQTTRIVGDVTEIGPEFTSGLWAMILYPRTSITRKARSGETGFGEFVPSTSDLCATSGCIVNWSCSGDFDERESSGRIDPITYSFEGIEIDVAATAYDMQCEGRSNFTIYPVVPRQAPEPTSASRRDEIMRLFEENILRDLQRRASDTE